MRQIGSMRDRERERERVHDVYYVKCVCVSRVYLYSAYVGGVFIDILRVWIDTNSSSQKYFYFHA